jgi:hypothetical protein
VLTCQEVEQNALNQNGLMTTFGIQQIGPTNQSWPETDARTSILLLDYRLLECRIRLRNLRTILSGAALTGHDFRSKLRNNRSEDFFSD